jgi:hypothetical protein
LRFLTNCLLDLFIKGWFCHCDLHEDKMMNIFISYQRS